jgi:DNA-binding SARP family transcriptional activator
MTILQICLLGSVKVTRSTSDKEMKFTPTIQTLFSYLLLQPHRTHSREVLAGVFWGEQSERKARASLNTALWRLRRVIEPEGITPGTYLLSNPTEIGFNQHSPYWLDVSLFDELTAPALKKPQELLGEKDVRDLEKAISLYKGELLEGLYDEWAIRERERLRLQYLLCLDHLMRFYKREQAYEKSLVYGTLILSIDPLREEIHRELMRLYLANRQRSLAIRQYESCRELLANELNISPMEETRVLYESILNERPPDMEAQSITRENPVEVIQQLRQVLHVIDQLQEQVSKSLQLVEKLNDPRMRG